MSNGQPVGHVKKTAPIAMGIGLIVTICISVVGWVLLAQSWAKDTRYVLLEQKIEYASSISSRNETLNHEHESILKELTKITERLIVNQENMQKQLDRIERKLP